MGGPDTGGANGLQEFPITEITSVGRFWLAGDVGNASDGLCRVEGERIEIEVADPLTPWMELTHVAGGVTLSPAPEIVDMTLHGAIPMNPANLTMLGARTVFRRRVHMPGGDAPEVHRLRADWCIAGAHVPGPGARFTGVRARFTHLELWAGSPVEMIHLNKPSNKVSMSFAASDPEAVPFSAFGESAELCLRTVCRPRLPDPWGAELSVSRWLQLSDLSGWTLDEVLARFVRPAQTLFTLVAGEHSSVTHVEVEFEGVWCQVYGDGVNRDSAQASDGRVLLAMDVLPLERVAAWCPLVARLSPAPQIAAAVWAGSFQTAEAEALALTTTAEGLDRALNPDSRRFTSSEVAESVEALRQSNVPERVQNELVNALHLYFYEDSYPSRMLRLAQKVANAVPTCVGAPQKWKNCIRDLRVNLAHSLPNSEAEEDGFWKMQAASLSLRWAIAVRLLQEVGVPDESLREVADESKTFKRHVGFWNDQLPEVFDV